jgi:sulfatase maturation enzyme AslB (radical SAM superfamily)
MDAIAGVAEGFPVIGPSPKLVISDDGSLYLIPEEYLQRGSFRREKSASRVLSLDDDQFYHFNSQSLQDFSVPDEVAGVLLRERGISGLVRPLTSPPTAAANEIPLYGNLRDPEWASIMLGGSCNSRCSFCYTSLIRKNNFSTSEAVDLIDRISHFGTVGVLVFTGGEVTIREDFPLLMDYARQRGFLQISLQTNGRELRDGRCLERLIESGLDSVLLSLHGATSETHDRVSGAAGSFHEALEALANLSALRVSVTTNTVICRDNYHELVNIPRRVSSVFGAGATLRFSYPIVEGAAFDNADSLLVNFSEVVPPLLSAIDEARCLGFQVETANFPNCLPDRDQTNVYTKESLSSLVQASPFYVVNALRGERSVKLQRCMSCTRRGSCPGIQIEYLKRFPESYVDIKAWP